MMQIALLMVIIILIANYAHPAKTAETNTNITQIFKIEKMLCNHTEACQTSQCAVEWIARNTQVMTIGCHLALPAQNNVRVKLVANYRFNHVYRQFLINLDMDFCGFMNRDTPNVFLATVMPYVSRYSNIDHPCPYSGNTTIHRMPLNNAFVQYAILPVGQYRVDVDIYDSKIKRSIFYFEIFFLIPQSRNARLDTTMG